MKKLLAVTSCPTGIAHTYMAAEGLEKAAREKGIEIKVETHGAEGVGNRFTEEEIAEAHAVIIAADTQVDESRFGALPIVRASVGEAIKDAGNLIEQALKQEPKTIDAVEQVQQAKKERSEQRSGPYKHLMTGVSHMIPLVVAGGPVDCHFFHFRHPCF